MKNDAPIGVFDSGLGGLTVVKEIIACLPNEKIVYFGDTARVPYGNKSKETVSHYAAQISEFLLTKQVKAVVVACNTVSALALPVVKEKFSVPVFGVLLPGAMAAKKETRGRVGIIGTKATIQSRAYEEAVTGGRPDIETVSVPCPLFVNLAEEGLWEDEITRKTAEKYLAPLREKNIDTLILGCTHYPLLLPVIRETIGPRVTIINPAEEAAKELAGALASQGLLRGSEGNIPEQDRLRTGLESIPEQDRLRTGLESIPEHDRLRTGVENIPEHEFYVSDRTNDFSLFAERILSFPVTPKKENVEKYQ